MWICQAQEPANQGRRCERTAQVAAEYQEQRGDHAAIVAGSLSFVSSMVAGILVRFFQRQWPTVDIIYLHEIRIETIIGVYEWERRSPQTVIVDIELGTDIRTAAATERIKDTVDYKAVAQRIIAYTRGSEFRLLETLAEKIAEILLHEFKSPWCRLRLNKLGVVKGVRDVGVIIERSRS